MGTQNSQPCSANKSLEICYVVRILNYLRARLYRELSKIYKIVWYSREYSAGATVYLHSRKYFEHTILFDYGEAKKEHNDLV